VDETDDGGVPSNPLRHLRSWRFGALNRLVVVVGEEAAPDGWTELTMRRSGLTWKLSSVRLPQRLLADVKAAVGTATTQAQ
jgi:hypothetical protein